MNVTQAVARVTHFFAPLNNAVRQLSQLICLKMTKREDSRSPEPLKLFSPPARLMGMGTRTLTPIQSALGWDREETTWTEIRAPERLKVVQGTERFAISGSEIAIYRARAIFSAPAPAPQEFAPARPQASPSRSPRWVSYAVLLGLAYHFGLFSIETWFRLFGG
jgi:hypothetical protein